MLTHQQEFAQQHDMLTVNKSSQCLPTANMSVSWDGYESLVPYIYTTMDTSRCGPQSPGSVGVSWQVRMSKRIRRLKTFTNDLGAEQHVIAAINATLARSPCEVLHENQLHCNKCRHRSCPAQRRETAPPVFTS